MKIALYGNALQLKWKHQILVFHYVKGLILGIIFSISVKNIKSKAKPIDRKMSYMYLIDENTQRNSL
jgi:hypothetical protein